LKIWQKIKKIAIVTIQRGCAFLDQLEEGNNDAIHLLLGVISILILPVSLDNFSEICGKIENWYFPSFCEF